MNLSSKVLKEAPITVDIPPQPPAHIQTIQQEPTASGPIKFNFKDFYKATTSKVPDISKAVSSVKDSFIKKAADYIKKHEGYRRRIYDDGKKNPDGTINWTIGIGHLLQRGEYEKYKDKELTDDEILALFDKDLRQKIAAARKEFGSQFDSFSDDLKVAIVDGYFRGDLPKSPRTIKLLKAGRFKEAAIEYLDHDEYRASKSGKSGMGGIAPRMERNAQIMAAEKN